MIRLVVADDVAEVDRMLQNKAEADGAVATDDRELNAHRDRVAELEREIAQLREALDQRQLYGVVTGVLAARFGLTPERTWSLLVRLSQHTNVKMRVVTRVIHDSYFGRLSPEDQSVAVRLDAELRGQLDLFGAGTRPV